MTKIQLKRSSALLSGSAQAPTSSQLDYGELAINYNSSDPQLFFKDSTGSVVSLFDNYAALGGATFTGDVAFSADVDFDGAVTIKGDSTNGSGKLSLTCEQNTHTVNIKAPAHSSAANYTLTLPSSAGTSSQVLTTDGSGNLSWAVSSMSTADKNKLDGIETGAQVNTVTSVNGQTGAVTVSGSTDLSYTASTRVLASSTGNDATIPEVIAAGDSGLMTGADKTKLDGIEANATADQTAAEILSALLTVDGSGSGLDADLLDGLDSTQFLRSDVNDTLGGVLSYTSDTARLQFTNTTYSAQLHIGGWTTTNSNDISRIRNSNGNLHIDSAANGNLYLNHYSTGAVLIRGNTAWHAGNDGAGSGLDADNLDGYTWASSGKDVRGSQIYTDGWFRNYDSGEGLYNQALGSHWYSDQNGVWNLTGNTQNMGTNLKFRGTHNGNVEGWIHANGGGWLGTLNTAGQWALKSYNPDGFSPNLWFDEEANETWTGNPGSDEGKIEYHSNRFYIAAGSNSTEVVRFRRSNADVAYINNSGYFYSPIMYDINNTGYYIDPASHSNLNTARFQGNACYIRGGSPTLYFQDTNHNSAMLHNNSNLLYVLRGGNDSTSWSQVNAQWPFIWYLTNNNARCGGSFEAVGNVTAYSSDRRLKQNFKPIESALDKVNALNGLYFDWKTEVIDLGFTPDQMTDDIGLIAQDVQAVLPQAVKPAPFDQTWDDDLNKNVSTSGEDYITVQYERLVPLLVEAIKELSVRLTSLEDKL